MAILIDGEEYKELLCQDNDCMRVLGQIRKVGRKPGIILRLKCHTCGLVSIWRFGYSQLEESFDKLKDIVEMKGGEN